jgi:hypothetical protein
MKPAIVHLHIRRGTTLHRIFHLQDAASQPVDLTGYTPLAQARQRPGEALAFDLPFTITDATGGIMAINRTPTQTPAYPAGRFVWDLLLQHTASGDIYGPFMAGDCLVQDGPTMPTPPPP